MLPVLNVHAPLQDLDLIGLTRARAIMWGGSVGPHLDIEELWTHVLVDLQTVIGIEVRVGVAMLLALQLVVGGLAPDHN